MSQILCVAPSSIPRLTVIRWPQDSQRKSLALITNDTSRTPFTVNNKAKGKTVIHDNLSEA